MFLLLLTPLPSHADPDLVEPEQVFDWGEEWTYREGTVEAGIEWPLAIDGVAPSEDGWLVGPTPIVARSQTRQEEIEAVRREQRRRGRRRSPSFDGTLEIYRSEDYPALPGMPPDYEPGPNAYLFVKTFEIADPSQVQSVFLELKFSGGFVAYLNGREWLRHNLDPGHRPDDPAHIRWLPEWVSQTVGNVWQRAFVGLDPALLRAGENTLAIEVHRRWNGGSWAIYLDGQMRTYRDVGFIKSPYLQRVQENEITVMWETSVNAIGYVEFGSGDHLDRVATSPRVAASMNEVTLTGLEPNTRYFYRVHSIPTDGTQARITSPIYYFRTSVPRGTPFSFLLYGDNRTNSSTHAQLVERMVEEANRHNVGFIVNTGDLITHGAPWDEWQDEFFRPALPLLSHFPMYASLGNHEGNHETWYEYLSLPGNESWYTFGYGDVDFFMLNSSTDLTEGSAQLDWLREALAASTAPWKIAVFHHPAFSCVPVRKPGNAVIRDSVVPVLEEYGVDLVLLGHDHLYGRSFPINGVVYVISGGGGASTYPAEPDEFNEVCVQTHHYCILRVAQDAIQLEAIGLDGELLDTYALTH